MNNSVCAFSGHRQICLSHIDIIVPKLSETIDALINSGVTHFLSGGAVGFDMIAANEVLKKRENGADISLSMILPCRTQERIWPPDIRFEYGRILSLADDVIYTSDSYSRFCMHIRNRRLVDEAGILLC